MIKWLAAAVGVAGVSLLLIFLQYPGRFILGAFMAFVLFVGWMMLLTAANSFTRSLRDPVRDPDIGFGLMVCLSLAATAISLAYIRPFEVNLGYWVAGIITALGFGALCLVGEALSQMMEGADNESRLHY